MRPQVKKDLIVVLPSENEEKKGCWLTLNILKKPMGAKVVCLIDSGSQFSIAPKSLLKFSYNKRELTDV